MEPIGSSETSANNTQTPGIYPKESRLQVQHGENQNLRTIRSYVPLPDVLASKKAIINVQNKKNKCFLWAILSALHPADGHSNRVTKYR